MNLELLKAKLSQKSPADLLALQQFLFNHYESLSQAVKPSERETLLQEFNSVKEILDDAINDVVNNLLDNN